MTQEDKDLLLQDLCARVPYGVKVNAPFTTNKEENAKGYKINGINFGVIEWTPILFGEKKQRNSIIIESFSKKYNQYCSIDIEENDYIEEVKPYLFPLSSMSEEERIVIGNEFAYGQPHKAMDILHKKHIDYRGLIPKRLAIDATGKNIYCKGND